MTRTHGLLRRVAILTGVCMAMVIVLPVVCGAQDRAWAAVLDAQRLADAGRYQQAESLYTFVLTYAGATGRTRATALFGRASATQRRRAAIDTVAEDDEQRRIVRDYEEAARIDTTFRGAGLSNVGVMYRDAGRYDVAARAFLAAANSNDRGRATYLVNGGRALAALGQWPRAAATFAAALRADSTNRDARLGLLDATARGFPLDSLVAVGRAALAADSAAAPAVADALVLALGAGSSTSSRADVDALVLLARSDATMRVGPPYFANAQRDALDAIGKARPSLRPGIAAMTDAYRLRETSHAGTPVSAYQEPPDARWWAQSLETRTAWSTLLRSIADWYNVSDAGDVALGFYEAAVGRRTGRMLEPWVDLDALLPLMLLTMQRAGPDGASDLDTRVAEVTDAVFEGKARAYAQGDLQRIRTFHTTLGAVYAQQGKWDGGVRSATFQLERMRRTSAELARRTGKPVVDPPALLEQLVRGYKTTGRQGDAERLARELKGEYVRAGRGADTIRVNRALRDVVPPRDTARVVPRSPAVRIGNVVRPAAVQVPVKNP